jgi:hypothetical protein
MFALWRKKMLKAIKKAIESFKYWVNYYPPELKDMHRKAMEANKATWAKDFDVKDVKKALNKQAPKPAAKKATTRRKTVATKPGLYSNIHAKQERIEKQKAAGGKVETMRKPGSKGAPTAKAFKESAKTAKK